MTSSNSNSGSWARNSVLWMQVATVLNHGHVGQPTRDRIRTNQYDNRQLQSVGISAADGGYRVAYWNLLIDWPTHQALLSSDRIIQNRGEFGQDQVAFALAELVRMVEDYFADFPNHQRGWTFTSIQDFQSACASIGVGAGQALTDHPMLGRVGGLAIPGMEEASVEVFGIL